MSLMQKLSLSALLLGTVACSTTNYYQVQSTYRIADVEEQKADVTKSRGFDTAFEKIDVIAVKAPDRCISETQSEKTGQARGTGTVMKTECGVEMAQIERHLAQAGFSVVSWKLLQNQMESLDLKERSSIQILLEYLMLELADK